MTLGVASPFNVRDYGAVGNGQTLDSPAIRSAIDACAANGGGTVYLPAGQYLTGSLFLRNNISLHLDSGAVILGSENPDDYPIVHGRWGSISTRPSLMAVIQAFISGCVEIQRPLI